MEVVANRLGLQAALDKSTSTVTNFLEELVGEGIDAQADHHDIVSAPTANVLRVPEGEPLLHRSASLRGRISGVSYVYAESVIVTSRLPRGFHLRLQSSTDPIGRILDEMGIAVTREDLVDSDGFVVSRPNRDERISNYLFARTYRISSDQTPLMVITEWFLQTLTPFLSSA